jgi:CMP-N,N'-diacetyllegionaminic acid synthase
MKKLVLCFDLDNTICSTYKNNYKKSRPFKQIVNLINSLKKKGFFIKIFTSRYMGRTDENAILAKKLGYNETRKQLKKWGLRYSQLIFGKPSYDIFIDDKMLSFNKNWPSQLKRKIKYLT